MNYPYSYKNYKYGGSTYGLPSFAPDAESGPYDFSGGGFSTTPFSVQSENQPEKSKFDIVETLYGAGALAEGIGNLVRGIRGDDTPPSRMAGKAFEEYKNKDKPDYLMALLREIVAQRESQNNPLLSLFKTGSGSNKVFGSIFS